MKITIWVEDENLDHRARVTAESFESAEEGFGKLQRNYARRVAMELSKSDVMAESLTEEA
jgi:hypothetical protein